MSIKLISPANISCDTIYRCVLYTITFVCTIIVLHIATVDTLVTAFTLDSVWVTPSSRVWERITLPLQADSGISFTAHADLPFPIENGVLAAPFNLLTHLAQRPPTWSHTQGHSHTKTHTLWAYKLHVWSMGTHTTTN